MQLWFARDRELTIREQLVTQIILGILSDDLAPGQRLPSTVTASELLQKPLA